MDKQKPEVIIESAEPYSDVSSQSESEEEKPLPQKRAGRLNAYAVTQGNYIPRGMRPVNSTLNDIEEQKQEESEDEGMYGKRRDALSLTHPLVLVAASIGIGILISYYGVGFINPAVDKVVEAAEEIVDENQ